MTDLSKEALDALDRDAEIISSMINAGERIPWSTDTSMLDRQRAVITALRQQLAAAETAALERAAAWHDGERDRIISELSDPRFDGKESLYLDAAADHETAADAIRNMITPEGAPALEAEKTEAERDAAQTGAVKVKPLVWQELPKAGYTAFDDVFKECVYADTDDEKRSVENVRTARIYDALIPADAIAARDAQMRAEGRVAGLREAAEIAGLNAWKHAGEDEYSRGMDAGAVHQVKACCDAIRALADKIEGDTVKVGGHYRECGE